MRLTCIASDADDDLAGFDHAESSTTRHSSSQARRVNGKRSCDDSEVENGVRSLEPFKIEIRVPNMEQPPEVIQPLWFRLADITGWFNWDALAAIGTVGALWFVVIQTTRAGRAERARAIGVLTYLIGLLEPIEIVSIFEETTNEDLKNLPGNQLEHDLSIVRRAIQGLDALSLPDASLVGAVEWTMTAPLALRDIQRCLLKRSLEDHSGVMSDFRYIQEFVQHLRAERDGLRRGWIMRAIQRSRRYA